MMHHAIRVTHTAASRSRPSCALGRNPGRLAFPDDLDQCDAVDLVEGEHGLGTDQTIEVVSGWQWHGGRDVAEVPAGDAVVLPLTIRDIALMILCDKPIRDEDFLVREKCPHLDPVDAGTGIGPADGRPQRLARA